MIINFHKIEEKWQRVWKKNKIFETDVNRKKEKFFITIPYPYVNNEPHIGNGFTWFRGDSYARFKRMQGYNVLFPQGFHATGEPILGVVERLEQQDPDQIQSLKSAGANDEDIKNFVKYGPEFVVKYWMKRWIEVLKYGGFAIDWRRTFVTAVTPTYNRFIEWQYNTLRKGGFVTQGTHPVIWCPHCESPTGDHDRLKGEGESPIEYTVLKFKLADSDGIIPCGTLRPETIYGVTNIWINPNVKYFWTKVNGERWLLSEKAIEKLKDQLKNVKELEEVLGKNLVGKYVENPATKNKVIILPADFVNPKAATGIVMSVPSHAPYDWVALNQLQKNPELIKEYDVDFTELKKIKPISIIEVEGFGEHPAIEISQKMSIESQNEKEKLDKVTHELYTKEYHTGILKEVFGEFAGKKISDVKEMLIHNFQKSGYVDTMWEMTGLVVCRCTTENHVKILENQWFLKFSDQKWKNRVKKLISRMSFYPEEARNQFLATVDWFKDKACARKSGLGTKLPWDKEWIVETLSDSTIYMAYYTISRIINEKKIPSEKLTDEVFDFVFLGKGNLKTVVKISKLSKKVLKEMREEFEYFYPLDLRTTAKDLLQNHMTLFLFHHTAVWNDSKFWPRSVAINGFVNIAGRKMSKRFGNVISLRQLIKKHGTDLTRINLVSVNENMDDADWREENVEAFVSRIQFLYDLVKDLPKAKIKETRNIEKYLLSRVQSWIKSVTGNFEVLRFRSATQKGFFEAINDLKWYLDRCEKIQNCNRSVLSKAVSELIKIVAPLLPHNAEEIWNLLDNKKLVILEKWPEYQTKFVDENAEMNEHLIATTLEDINQVEKLLKRKSKEVHIFVAPKWKFEIYKMIIKNKKKTMKELIALIKNKNEEKIKYLQHLQRKSQELPENFVSRENQLKIFRESVRFFEKRLNAKVFISTADDSEIEKAKQTDVIKPAIYLTG